MKKIEADNLVNDIGNLISGSRSDDAMAALGSCLILSAIAVDWPKQKLLDVLGAHWDNFEGRLSERNKANPDGVSASG